MLRKKILLVSSFLIFFVFLSCNPHFQSKKASISIPLPGSKNVSRTVHTNEETYYKITCSRLDISFNESMYGYSGDQIKFENLTPGTYEITGQAFEDSDMKIVIYEGSTRVTLQGGKEETVVLFLDGSYNIMDEDIVYNAFINGRDYDSYFQYKSIHDTSGLNNGYQNQDSNYYQLPLSVYQYGNIPPSSDGPQYLSNDDFGNLITTESNQLYHHKTDGNIDKACFIYNGRVYYVMEYNNSPIISLTDNPKDMLFNKDYLGSNSIFHFKFWEYIDDTDERSPNTLGYGYQAKHIRLPDGIYVDITLAEYYYNSLGFRVWIKESTPPAESTNFLEYYNGIDASLKDMLQINLNKAEYQDYLENATAINIQQWVGNDWAGVCYFSKNNVSVDFRNLTNPPLLYYVTKNKEYTFRFSIFDNNGTLYTSDAQTITALNGLGEIKQKSFSATYNSSTSQLSFSTNSLFTYTLPADNYTVRTSFSYATTDNNQYLDFNLFDGTQISVIDAIKQNANQEELLNKQFYPRNYGISIDTFDDELYVQYGCIIFNPTNLPVITTPSEISSDPEFVRLNSDGYVEFNLEQYSDKLGEATNITLYKSKNAEPYTNIITIQNSSGNMNASDIQFIDPYVTVGEEYKYYFSITYQNDSVFSSSYTTITAEQGYGEDLVVDKIASITKEDMILSFDKTPVLDSSKLIPDYSTSFRLWYTDNFYEGFFDLTTITENKIDLKFNTNTDFTGKTVHFNSYAVTLFKEEGDYMITYKLLIPVDLAVEFTFPTEAELEAATQTGSTDFLSLNENGYVLLNFNYYSELFDEPENKEIHINRKKSTAANYEEIVLLKTDSSSHPFTFVDYYLEPNETYSYELVVNQGENTNTIDIENSITPTAGLTPTLPETLEYNSNIATFTPEFTIDNPYAEGERAAPHYEVELYDSITDKNSYARSSMSNNSVDLSFGGSTILNLPNPVKITGFKYVIEFSGDYEELTYSIYYPKEYPGDFTVSTF